jgi:hypothetical protein
VQAAFLYIKSMWVFIIRQKMSVHPSKCLKTALTKFGAFPNIFENVTIQKYQREFG